MNTQENLKMTDDGICPRCGYSVYQAFEDGSYDLYWYCEKCGWEGF